jgi:hypothetical protein
MSAMQKQLTGTAGKNSILCFISLFRLGKGDLPSVHVHSPHGVIIQSHSLSTDMQIYLAYYTAVILNIEH